MKKIVYILYMSIFITSLHAQQDFDVTFSGDGWATESFIGFQESYSDILIQADKKILVAGATAANTVYSPYVRRLHTNGSIDNSFGNAGRAVLSPNTIEGVETHISIATDSDGKIYVASSISGAQAGLYVSRLNMDGTIDNTFGNNGSIADSTHTDVYFEDIKDIVVQNDGKILIGGYYRHNNPTKTGAFVIRYTIAGSRDASFGVNGFAKIEGENFVANKLLIQADGKILGGGKRRSTTQQKDDFLVFRLNTDGSLDNSYSPTQDGIVIIGLQDIETVRDMALQSDGSLIFGGPCGNGYTHTRIVKLQPNGVGDVNFGTEQTSTGNIGYTKLDFVQYTDQYITSLAVTADDKILVGGNWNNEIFVIRYTADGIPDSKFSGNARADSTFFQYTLSNNAGVLDEASGRFYNIGTISFTNPELYVAAFKIGSGTAPSSVAEAQNNEIIVFPNPSIGILSISSPEKYNRLEMFDVTGKLVLSQANFSTNSIDVSNLQNGIYYLKLISEGKCYHKRIIVAQ